MNVLIVNYNSGNLASLYNSFLKATKERKKKINLIISNKPQEIDKADKVILPGVGDFASCKNQLININGMIEALNKFVHEKKKTIFRYMYWNAVNGKKKF